ncbi:BTAD domain-containing putative transcriptional regulator [Actinocorallia aurea]
MAEMAVRLFGALEVIDGAGRPVEVGAPKQRAVLAMLAVDPGRAVPVDRLIAELWAGEAPASATGTLQAYLSQLRRALEPDRPPRTPPRLLLTREPGYLLAVRPGQVDLARFAAHAEDARRALRGGDHAAALADLDRALALWQGDPLAEFAGFGFAQPVRARLGELRAAALEDRAEARLALGDAASCVADLEQLVDAHPYRERMWGLLVLALYRSRRQAEALGALRRVRALLADELGLEPGPELRALERAVFEQSPELDAPPAPASPAPASPAPASPANAPTRPAEAGPGPSDGLVGRGPERDTGAALLAAARAGRGGLLLLAGEAGVGKTRLARAVAEEAAALGVRTAWGRCAEDTGAPPFWPWLQVLRDLGVPGADLLLGQGAGGMSPFALHSAALEALTGGPEPRLLVLDDLHWADASSLRLLTFAAAELHRRPVLVVATLRPEPGGAPEQLTDALGALAREQGVTRLDVPPLTVAEVGAYLERTGNPGGPRLAARLHERTGGNPFYLGELLRLPAAERGLGLRVPPGVREVISRRVARLPEGTGALLRTASVLGREFGPEMLSAVSGAQVPDVLSRLEPAVAVGLLTELPDGFDYAFAHPLVRDALYSGLSRLERARAHLGAGAAVEAAPGLDRAVRLPALAHHYGMAAPVGGAAKAVEYASAAARQAAAQHAHHEAAGHWERALDALGSADPERRRGLLVELGLAHHARGDVAGARASLETAIDLASEAGDRDTLIRALAVFGGHSQWMFRAYGEVDARIVALLRELLAGPLPDARRAELLGTLALELHYGPDRADGEALAAEAVAIARRLGDPALLARTLNNQVLVLYVMGREAERAAALREMLAVPGLGGQAECVARIFLATSLIRDGDLPGCRAELRRVADLAEAMRDRAIHAMTAIAETAALTLEGRWAEVEQVVERYTSLLEGSTMYGLEFCRWNGLMTARRALGDAGGLLDGLLAEAETTEPLRPTAVLALLESGDEAGARALMARWGTEIRRTWTEDFHAAVWGRIAARLGTPDPAELYRRLAPHRDELVIAGIGITSWGSVHGVLAELAAALGDRSLAREHAEAARAVHVRLGLAHWAAESERLLAAL